MSFLTAFLMMGGALVVLPVALVVVWWYQLQKRRVPFFYDGTRAKKHQDALEVLTILTVTGAVILFAWLFQQSFRQEVGGAFLGLCYIGAPILVFLLRLQASLQRRKTAEQKLRLQHLRRNT